MQAMQTEELARFSRQIALPQFGREGQEKLRRGSAIIIGAGGLGSPSSMYLAAAGLGRIGLVDDDRVDVSNLHRQLLHSSADIGRPKIESAAERLRSIHPGVTIEVHQTRLTSANAMEILRDYDIVVDGSDNFPTRYLVNDVCVFLGKPNIYGSVFRFEGQASVFDATRGPCYRCLYAQPPPPHLVPSCEEGGVLGVLPGVIGMLQASEAIKVLTGVGEPLIGRLLMFDALKAQFRELKLKKNNECVVCGKHPSVTQLIDYEGFCGMTEQKTPGEISAQDLATRLKSGEEVTLIDVREPFEWDIVRLEKATLIPLRTLPRRLSELDPARAIVVYCHVGARSASAADFLRDSGFSNVANLRGGIDAWAREVDPSLPRY